MKESVGWSVIRRMFNAFFLLAVTASTLSRYSLVLIKKALAGLPGGGDLGKAETVCPATLFSNAASRVFSHLSVSACRLLTRRGLSESCRRGTLSGGTGIPLRVPR